MTEALVVCAKPFCAHPAYNHEDSTGALGKCRYWGCRCRGWRAPQVVAPPAEPVPQS